MPFFYVDWYYIVLVLPAVILSLWASAKYRETSEGGLAKLYDRRAAN